jgi:hypothetical protein
MKVFAARVSGFCLVMLGYIITREGNMPAESRLPVAATFSKIITGIHKQ